MVFIVESGSTKADWILLADSGTEVGRWSVKGLNPYFHDADEVERTLRAEDAVMSKAPMVKKVFFYGAGCVVRVKVDLASNGLARLVGNCYE